ncbi:MAG TPA: rhodanese-like domain-containing protein, partial [Nitrososphaerales archaeon]|nr:rhodanese-like domain-containing protein [Nitrososphaerales archaeon]
SIPQSQLQAGRWKELDKRKEIVTHCSSFTCTASRETAEFLEQQGYNVKAYEGGMREWAESRLPTEGKYTPEKFLEEKYGQKQSMPAR